MPRRLPRKCSLAAQALLRLEAGLTAGDAGTCEVVGLPRWGACLMFGQCCEQLGEQLALRCQYRLVGQGSSLQK